MADTTALRSVSPLAVFFLILGVIKLNQYLFFHFNTSPAIILMPAGIALAAIYLGGYRMWMPIAFAWFLGTLSSPSQLSIPLVFAVSIAYPLQAVIGGYFLRRLNFLGTLERTRCALVLIGTALLLPVVAPSITTGVQWLTGSLSVPAWTSWSRAWTGGVMSIMVFTPLITIWYRLTKTFHKRQARRIRKELIGETVAAMLTLVLSVYITFWTNLPQNNTFLVLYLLFSVLFWIGLRLHPRMITLAIFLTATLGMAGSIIAHPGALPLNQQLLSNELFIILIAPIFFILTALVQERQNALEKLAYHISELEIVLRRISSEDEAKKEFLAVLSHELRNPLATILSSIELLNLQGARAPNSAMLLETIDDRSRAMIRLLDDILDVTRISKKKLELRMETVALNKFIDKLANTIQQSMRKYGHTLYIEKPDEELFLDADPARLEQIFTNLLTNSAKYTKPNGLIEFGARRDGNMAVVHVRDSGIGIPKNMIKRIFEPFFQVNSDKIGSEGLGIGLSLTRQLVEMHGGTIEATSGGVGMGAEFIVRLPLKTESAHDAPAHISTGVRYPSMHTIRKIKNTFNILIADDNETAADTLSKMLELRGHTVATAYTGLEAVQKALEFKPDVVILDIGLPDISGYEVAEKLLRQNKSYYLVALTGYGQAEDKERAKQAGFYHHLTKPAGLKEIEAVLRRISRERYARRR